jgi:hypothetical protein
MAVITTNIPQLPRHAARRVAIAIRGVDGRLMVVCPA